MLVGLFVSGFWAVKLFDKGHFDSDFLLDASLPRRSEVTQAFPDRSELSLSLTGKQLWQRKDQIQGGRRSIDVAGTKQMAD